jgi:hypothetical protein
MFYISIDILVTPTVCTVLKSFKTFNNSSSEEDKMKTANTNSCNVGLIGKCLSLFSSKGKKHFLANCSRKIVSANPTVKY